MYNKIRHSRKGFTLLELIVGMTIFSLGITSIFLLLSQTMKSVTISRNEVVVANLLREQIELVRNIRDTNIIQAAKWDSGINAWTFLIENNFTLDKKTFDSNGNVVTSPVSITQKLISDVTEVKDNEKLQAKFTATQLCYDTEKRYVHCDSTAVSNGAQTPTIFASYINIEPMKYTFNGTDTPIKKDGNDQWYIIDARVIVRDWSNYREYDARSAITDWIK